MSKPLVTSHFHLYRIESNWLRRAVIVATMPLLFAANLGLMLLGVALFWWKNQRELFKSAAHYWRTSDRWVPIELGPDGKEWAKTEAGYKHVNEVAVPRADGYHGAALAPWWHGWAVREAFVAGAEWQEQRGAGPRPAHEATLTINAPNGDTIVCHGSKLDMMTLDRVVKAAANTGSLPDWQWRGESSNDRAERAIYSNLSKSADQQGEHQ